MKKLIVYCHPNPKSFNNAVLTQIEENYKNEGDEVRVRDLYAMGFDPVLKGEDFMVFQKGDIPADIKEEQEHITWTDDITFIYPVWWFHMPAILKGYIDRVFSMGFAYKPVDGGIEGLLIGKTVNIINTTGGPEAAYTTGGFRGSIKQMIDVGIFSLCGMTVKDHKLFHAVPYVSDEDRKGMLENV
jgi:NAD(P)H dehydrogenase (quinone)